MARCTVKVSQDNIDRGEKYCTRYCPLARAIAPLLRGDVEFGVLYDMLCLSRPRHKPAAIMLTKAQQKFADEYDRGMISSPATFRMEIPNEFLLASPE